MTNKTDISMHVPFCGAVDEDGVHRLTTRVYYADTDFSGVVYHGSYLEFFERGRTEFLRLSDIHHHVLAEGAESEAVAWIVRRMTLDFAAPAHIDDILCVETSITSVTPARIRMAQRILRDDKMLVGATVEAAMINGLGRPRRLPQVWLDRFMGG